MPWPVLSGANEDVTFDNIQQFYDAANKLWNDDQDESFDMIFTEKNRWASHNLEDLFGKDICRGLYRQDIRTIQQVVTKRLEAILDTMTARE